MNNDFVTISDIWCYLLDGGVVKCCFPGNEEVITLYDGDVCRKDKHGNWSKTQAYFSKPSLFCKHDNQ